MRPLWDFPGGIELPDHTAESTVRPVTTAPIPAELVIPLQQNSGTAPTVTVRVGDTVRRGDRLAAPGEAVSAAVHASSSGTVTAIEDRPVPHPSGLPARCVVIATDGRDAPAPPLPAMTEDQLTPEGLAERAEACGVVGLGGATFPTHAKLDAPGDGSVATLILNGAECEPWISADEMLMRTRAERVIEGARLTARALQPAETVIAVEDDKTETLAALTDARDAAGAEAIEIVAVPARYPVGGEKQLIQVLTGREVPSGDVPPSIGVVCLNVATAVALRDAVRDGQPVTQRFISVTGDGVAEPRVVEARIGTPLTELVALAGGYAHGVDRLIMGGPMMGFSLDTDVMPVTKGSNCLLAGTTSLFPRPQPALPCIRCSACSDACPASLLPQQLYWYARADDLEQTEDHQVFDCIECGICAEVCPSHIPLVDYFRYAKDAIRRRDEDRRKAELARQRYEARKERLAREEAEKRARREAKKAALKQGSSKTPGHDERKQAVQDALARARQRKRGGGDGNGSEGAD
jgi:electron transport complex protein RnfC